MSRNRSGSVNKPLLFEVSSEVCNASGGIATVIESKAHSTVEAWGDRYCLLGIYVEASAAGEFEPLEAGDMLASVIEALRNDFGIEAHFGRWLIEGNPRVLLFDIWRQYDQLDNMKKELWERFQSPTPEGDENEEVNRTVLFGFHVLHFMRKFCEVNDGRPIICQFHEWLAGVGLPLIRDYKVPVATIFTTHATILGRYLCSGKGGDFYNSLPNVDPDARAGDLNIYSKFFFERLAAHSAHVFTTVSEITGVEARFLLTRQPDLLLPNGLRLEKFSALHEFQNLHAEAKEKIHEFVRGHFYGHYNFSLDRTIYLFSAGRFEPFNKGYDMYIESLARLNHRMKEARRRQPSDQWQTVVAFLITKKPTRSYNVESLHGQSVIRGVRAMVDSINEKIYDKIFESVARGEMPDVNDLLDDADQVLLKRRILSLRRERYPPITTHDIPDDADDPVLNQLRDCGLVNAPDDPVKVIYHPQFLSSASPVLPLDYKEFVRGCHLGVFPSYYEPWGYTPAECTVLGVPSVTSNLSGFGNYVHDNIEKPANKGLFIVDRRFQSPEESMEQLVDLMSGFTSLSRRERIMMRNRCENCSTFLDWKRLGRHYETARELALRRFYSPDWHTMADDDAPTSTSTS